MSTINHGGPAFPVLQHTSTGYLVMSSGGMTLRDFFAAQAMQGWIASFESSKEPDEYASSIAKCSYAIADAMIAARGI